MCDIRVMLEPGWVVIDIRHCHKHTSRTGERLWRPSITGNHDQGIIILGFSVQQCAGDDLSCGWVDGKLRVSTDDTVTEAKSMKKQVTFSYDVMTPCFL